MSRSKRTQILDAALDLFTQNGFHGTSTAAIARQAEVATGTLFHHFASKEVLIESLYREVKKELAKAFLQDIDDTQKYPSVETIWINGVSWLVANPKCMSFFLLCSHSLYFSKQIQIEIWQELLGFIAELFNEGVAKGLVKDLPVPYLLMISESLLLTTATYVHALPENEREAAIRSSINVIIDAISVPNADLHLLTR